MMKKQAINFSWPASLSEFNQDSAHENFTRGKLKVFYKGETADHRYFSDVFSEELVQSLPYTPVVSYYDSEKDDFVGHATEQQIYGMVDPMKSPSFEVDEDGTQWCVCDVVLYTERPDKVGDIAKKIVGHKQSLELDPKSVKYTVNYDEKKHFKNIEFTAGRFVGVSVLGSSQQPAFTGSEFFAYNEEFEKKMQVIRNYCEGKADQTQCGGENMNLNEFIKLSWGDISLKVSEAIGREYENDAFTYVVDMFEDSAIVRFYFFMSNESKLMRVKYSCSETGDVVLGNVNEVHMSYEDIESVPTTAEVETDMKRAKEKKGCGKCEDLPEGHPEIPEDVKPEDLPEGHPEVDMPCHSQADADVSDASCGPKDKEDAKCGEPEKKEDAKCGEPEKKEDCKCDEPCGNPDCPKDDKDDDINDIDDDDDDKEDCKCGEPKKEEPKNCEQMSENNFSQDGSNDPAQVENVEITPNTTTTEKVSVDDEENSTTTTTKEDSSSTSFTESERAEFEALKREKKIALVDSYKENLSEDQYNNFVSNIDTFEEKDLELELLKAYKASESSKKPMRAFAFAPIIDNAKTESSLDAFTRKYLNR